MNKIKKIELRQLAVRNPIAAELAKAMVETAAKVGARSSARPQYQEWVGRFR